MCGILAIIGKGKDEQLVRELSKRMTHRGPDESDLHITENGHILSHERLSIIDLHSGRQPIQGTSTAWMVHNGEVYNHQALRDGVLKGHTFRTKSDSEVIVHLYEEFKYDFCNMLDGDWAFVVVDGDDFIAQNLTIQNTAGEVGQAVALHLNSNRAMFVNCSFFGNHDSQKKNS